MHLFLLLVLLSKAKTPCFAHAMRIPPSAGDGTQPDGSEEYLERRLRTFRRATEDDVGNQNAGDFIFNQPFPEEDNQDYLPETVLDCYDQELVEKMPLADDPSAENSFIAKSRLCIELFVKIKEEVERENEEEERMKRMEEEEMRQRSSEGIVPYKTKYAQQQQQVDPPRDFFNAFSADPASSSSNVNKGGRMPSAPSFDASDYPSLMDPHNDTGPVVLAVVLIVGVVFLFFTCITCCAGAGSSASDNGSDDEQRQRDIENALVEQVLKRQAEESGLTMQQKLRRYNTMPAKALQKRDNLQHLYYNGLCWGATHASSFDAPTAPLTKGLSSETEVPNSTAATSPAHSNAATPVRKMITKVPTTDRDDESSASQQRRRQLLQMHTSQRTIEVAPSSKLERLLGTDQAVLVRSHSDRSPTHTSTGYRPMGSNGNRMMMPTNCLGLGRAQTHSNNSSFDV